MTPIIAGRFEQNSEAEQAAAALHRGGFAAQDVTIFFVNPPGQHDLYPIGGDEDASPGSKDADDGALKGVAIGGAVGAGVALATTPILGPAAILAGVSAGAYAGSLVGALGETDEKPARVDDGTDSAETVPAAPAPKDVELVRHGGMLVAVRAVEFSKRVGAVNILRQEGALDIERADGTWQDGSWVDFDPRRPVLLVDLPAAEGVVARK